MTNELNNIDYTTALDWIIPHIAPRRNGLIVVTSAANSADYDPEHMEEGNDPSGLFVCKLFEIYQAERTDYFFVPPALLQTDDPEDRRAYAKTIKAIAKERPTILACQHARTWLDDATVGLVVTRNPHVATVVAGEETGWTACILKPACWTLVHPHPHRVITAESFDARQAERQRRFRAVAGEVAA